MYICNNGTQEHKEEENNSLVALAYMEDIVQVPFHHTLSSSSSRISSWVKEKISKRICDFQSERPSQSLDPNKVALAKYKRCCSNAGERVYTKKFHNTIVKERGRNYKREGLFIATQGKYQDLLFEKSDVAAAMKRNNAYQSATLYL